ncbi:MAG: hypothetical protein ACI4CT_02210 [Lachnospiraceae bacterium]
MRASESVYEKVAKQCSEYTPKEKAYSFKSNTECQDCHTSCSTCEHFAEDEHCKLDLYDKIIAKMEA